MGGSYESVYMDFCNFMTRFCPCGVLSLFFLFKLNVRKDFKKITKTEYTELYFVYF